MALHHNPSPIFSSIVYFRALVNFTRSIEYSPQLEDASAKEFREVSEAVVEKVGERAYMGLGDPRGWQGNAGVCRRHLMVVCPPQLEPEYRKIPGEQIVSVVFIK